MSDAIQTSTWRRLRNTPLGDLLRLRASGQLDWRRVIDESDLADELKGVVREVVGRTRLWRSEKASVARELIAHFTDAAEANVPTERAIKRFGNPKQAARLIRRAKIRNRSYVWHCFRFIRRAIAALILFYIGATIYYLSGTPTVSVDYLAKLNAPILATPESEWAWPIYRGAVAVLNKDKPPEARWRTEHGWSTSAAWVDRHQQEIAIIRLGASRPHLGAPLGMTLSPEDAKVLEPRPTIAQSSKGTPLFAVMLPQLQSMRTFALALTLDTSRAVELKDGARVERDLEALFGIADQLKRRDVLASDLVGVGIRALGARALGRVLAESPELLSDAALVRLSHRFARDRVANDLMSYRGERYFFYDIVQRIYTDDGEGDGRLAPQAAEMFRSLQVVTTTHTDNPAPGWYEKPAELAIGPAAMLLTASRRDLLLEYDTYMDLLDAKLRQNLRDASEANPDLRILQLKADPVLAIRYALLATFAPALNRAQVSAERALGSQEGLQVAMALELYKRRNRAYPPSLDTLVPAYLPAIPADRIDGSPLRYRVVDGRPFLYSVGVDRDDDGGTPPPTDPMRAADWAVANPVDGDWVLFPPPAK